jgi:hypothetical protein
MPCCDVDKALGVRVWRCDDVPGAIPPSNVHEAPGTLCSDAVPPGSTPPPKMLRCNTLVLSRITPLSLTEASYALLQHSIGGHFSAELWRSSKDF